LGGHLAWTAHLLGSYFVISTFCQAGNPLSPRFALLLHAMTLGAGLVAVAAGLAAYAGWRRVRPAMEAGADPPQVDTGGDPAEALRAAGRTQILAQMGMVIDAFFLFAVVLGGAANFFVRPCH
jgi:hypothetical protein